MSNSCTFYLLSNLVACGYNLNEKKGIYLLDMCGLLVTSQWLSERFIYSTKIDKIQSYVSYTC